MIVLATGIEELERNVLALFPPEQVKQCYHRLALPVVVQQYVPEAVVISPHLEGDEDITNTVRKIRNMGIRVIFLPGEKDDRKTRAIIRALLPLGVYDYVFDPVTPDGILYRLQNPGKLGDFDIVPDEPVEPGATQNTQKIPVAPGIDGEYRDEKMLPAKTERKRDWINRLFSMFRNISFQNISFRRKETDYLTGCNTRREMEKHIRQLINNKKLFAFALIDFDNFKEINDTHGHLVGDRILTTFGNFLRENLRSGDGAYRYGGEEFAVIFVGATPENAKKVLERLQHRWLQVCRELGLVSAPTFSAGVALGNKDAIGNADKALYSAKNRGKNRVVVYDENAVIPSGVSLNPGKPTEISATRGTVQSSIATSVLPAVSIADGGKAKFYMVYSSASGVGKTAVSISLAHLLSRRGRVLLVDADTSGYTLTEHFAKIEFGKTPFVPIRPEGWEFELLVAPGGPMHYTDDRIKEVLSFAREYDFVVIDSAPGSLSLHAHIKFFLEKADRVFLLCTPEAKAVGAVRRFVNSEMRIIPGLKGKTRFVANRVHPLADRTPEEIGEETGVEINYTLPEDKFVSRMFDRAEPPGEEYSSFLCSLEKIVTKEIEMGGVAV